MEELVKTVLKYPMPVYTMETSGENEETFRDMAEAFIRVNKFGIRIGNLELMLSFMAGTIGGALKSQIRNLYEGSYKQFELDLQPTLRFAFSNFGLKQTQISKVEQFKTNIQKVDRSGIAGGKDVFQKCARSIELGNEILRQELGLPNTRLLPSQTPLIPIYKYFYETNLKSLKGLGESEVTMMIGWFLLATLRGYYSSRTDSKLDNDLQVVGKGSSPWERLIENMSEQGFKSKIATKELRKGLEMNVLRSQGRAFLLLAYVLLVKNNAEDWNGTRLERGPFSRLARHHIFPRDFLDSNLDVDDPDQKENMINNLGNITFIHESINSEIGDSAPKDYLADYKDSLGAHFIPSDRSTWTLDTYLDFLDQRIELMAKAGQKHFPEIFG